MDQQIVARTITLMGVVGTPFLLLALWHTKQASRLSWKIYSVSCLIVCGGAFLAGFLLSGVTDTVFHAVGHAFQLDRQNSAMAARIAISLLAASPAALLVGFYLVKKNTSTRMRSGSAGS